MRKKFLFFCFFCLGCTYFVGCSNNSDSVSKEEYEKILEERDLCISEKEEIEKQVDDLEKQVEDLELEVKTLSSEKELIQENYETYKEKMKPYEELEEAEAEARKIEAQKLIDTENEEKERLEQEERNKKENEEKAGYDTGITYDNLARTPDDYIYKKVKFKGKVIQVMEDDDSVQIRLAVNSDYNKVIYCEYEKDIVNSRVLENDIITIYGFSAGLISYESTLGSKITIPGVAIDKIEQ